MKLSDYTNNKKTKVENLTQFIDDNSQWQADYISDCPDFLDMYLDVCYDSEIYLGELDSETETLVQYLIDNNNENLIFDACNGVVTHGIYCTTNEIASCIFGEIEVQFSGIPDHDSNIHCIYTELTKDMSEEEIKAAENNAEFCVISDCLYMDYSYDRASLILDENDLIDSLLAA